MNATHSSSSPVAVLIGVVFLMLAALPLLFLAARMSGWTSLSKRYAARRPPPANVFLLSGTLRRFLQYRSTLRAGADAEGLYLSFWPRIGHPPLFLPWTDIDVQPAPEGLFRRGTMLLGKPDPVTFTTAATNVKPAAGNCGARRLAAGRRNVT